MPDKDEVKLNFQGMRSCEILFIILLVLKVGVGNTSVMQWSWWLIFLPILGGFAIVILAFIILFFVILLTQDK